MGHQLGPPQTGNQQQCLQRDLITICQRSATQHTEFTNNDPSLTEIDARSTQPVVARSRRRCAPSGLFGQRMPARIPTRAPAARQGAISAPSPAWPAPGLPCVDFAGRRDWAGGSCMELLVTYMSAAGRTRRAYQVAGLCVVSFLAARLWLVSWLAAVFPGPPLQHGSGRGLPRGRLGQKASPCSSGIRRPRMTPKMRTQADTPARVVAVAQDG